MAARASASVEATNDGVMIEDAVRAALACARPSIDEILSLWPSVRHPRLLLWAKLGLGGEISIGAHMREDVIARGSPELARQVRRVRGDIPVVLELDEVGHVVVSMRELKSRR